MSDTTPTKEPSLPPTTTHQQDLVVSGQRRVNLIWEVTQATIAVIITVAIVVSALYNVFTKTYTEIPLVLTSSWFLIIGFYFSRTNHQAIGGIGRKANREETDEYKGR